MKKIMLPGLMIAVAVISSCSSYQYYSVDNSQNNIGRYRTFAWLPPVESKNAGLYTSDLAEDKIRDAATAELTSRGLKLSNKQPDLLVRYQSSTEREFRTYNQPMYQYTPGFWSGVPYQGRIFYMYNRPYPVYVGSDIEKVPYKEGTLVIDLIDRNTHKVIWRGYGVGEVNNAGRTINALPDVVAGIFKKLPLRKAS